MSDSLSSPMLLFMIWNSCCKIIYIDPDLFFCSVPDMGRGEERRMSSWEQRTTYAEMRFGFIVEQLMLDDVHNPFYFYKTDITLFAFLFYVFLGQLKDFLSLNWKALSWKNTRQQKCYCSSEKSVPSACIHLVLPKYAVIFLPEQNSGSDLGIQHES